MTSDRFVILNVGHGASVALHSNGETSLIDTGSGSAVLEYLLNQGITRVDRVVLSHADQDHAGALITLLSDPTFEVASIWLNSDAFKRSKLWTALVYEIDEWRKQPEHDLRLGVVAGDSYRLSSIDVEVLAPRARIVGLGAGSVDREQRRLDTNTLSIVVRVLFNGAPQLLIPGDIDALGLEHLLDQDSPPDMTAPILVFPHHGGNVSKPSSSNRNADFARQIMALVQPATVVFSIGRGKHGTPRPEIVSAIIQSATTAGIRCTQLSAHCSPTTAIDSTIQQLRIAATGGIGVGNCCAGATSVKLGESASSLTPSQAEHAAFLATLPSPLCLNGQ